MGETAQPEASDEAVGQIAEYFRRLEGPALKRVQEDMATLEGYARHEKWSKGLVMAIKVFLPDLGIGEDGVAPDDEDE